MNIAQSSLWTRCRALIASAAMVLLVTACGGGGSSDTATETASSASPASSASNGTGDTGTSNGSTGSGGGSTGDTSSGDSGSAIDPSTKVLGPTQTGVATYYVEANGEGNCSFDATPNDLMVAAMNTIDYRNAAVCGEFVEVTGPKGTITVRIVDSCPTCTKGHIDLSPQAFSRIGDLPQGVIPISWKVVKGEQAGPVQYRYQEGSTRYWMGIQVRNHNLPVTRLEILPSGSSNWTELPRQDWNYFTTSSTVASGPIQVRVTGLGGAVLQDTLPAPMGGLVSSGAAQFP